MNSMRNRVHLIGHLGADPEVRDLDKGNKLARANLATNDYYKNAKGEKVTDTQWHTLVAWGKTAELFQKYTQKGQEIAIEGRLINRQYENKEGEKRYTTEVEVKDLVLLGKK